MLTFESTHEYYLGPDTCLHFHEEHGTLLITPDHEDRVLISGIKKETMLDFARNLIKRDLEESLESTKLKDAEPVPNMDFE